MKKIMYLLNDADEIGWFLGSIIKFDNEESNIKIVILSNISGTFQATMNRFLRNTKIAQLKELVALSAVVELFSPDMVFSSADCYCFRDINKDFYNKISNKTNLFLKDISSEQGNENIYLDISSHVDIKRNMLSLLEIEHDIEKVDSLNGLKCSQPYAEAFENFPSKEKSFNPILLKHKERKYNLVCFSRESIRSVKDFPDFLKRNKRENDGETIGDFYKSFINKQNNSTNERCIFVLFDSLTGKIIGTRTIENASGSLENKDFKKRNIDVFSLSKTFESDVKFAGDLVIDKEHRSQGLGKLLIATTNKLAQDENWILYGSTAWKDTKAIYESIGIKILNQVGDSIKYQWLLDKEFLKKSPEFNNDIKQIWLRVDVEKSDPRGCETTNINTAYIDINTPDSIIKEVIKNIQDLGIKEHEEIIHLFRKMIMEKGYVVYKDTKDIEEAVFNCSSCPDNK